jgi:hypothetical protein
LALAACDSGEVPSPADRQNAEVQGAPAGEVDPGLVTVRGDGLTAGAQSFFFAAGENEVKTALTASLGQPLISGELAECGAGPMNFTNYPGGLAVNFQDGNLVGWTLHGPSESSQEAQSANIEVSSDAAIGTPRAEIEAVPRFSVIEDSTLGEEFFISGQVAGFIEDDAVSMLYSGVQCFFR